mmetsp:Transcript_10032/g.15263  ORF Transcript_10032/g.15263 Transcript_10032/m.15263 type:complete len:223 (-) Transcript_10032:1091-1759(-)
MLTAWLLLPASAIFSLSMSRGEVDFSGSLGLSSSFFSPSSDLSGFSYSSFLSASSCLPSSSIGFCSSSTFSSSLDSVVSSLDLASSSVSTFELGSSGGGLMVPLGVVRTFFLESNFLASSLAYSFFTWSFSLFTSMLRLLCFLLMPVRLALTLELSPFSSSFIEALIFSVMAVNLESICFEVFRVSALCCSAFLTFSNICFRVLFILSPISFTPLAVWLLTT